MTAETSAPPLPRSVLIVGSGGREHAIIRALLLSPSRPRLLCAPGNAGIAQDAACFPIAADDIYHLVQLARREKVEFVIVGPEVPLAYGLADEMGRYHIPVYGPRRDGAQLEASKIYTKELLFKYRIPTAGAEIFDDLLPAVLHVKTCMTPIVVKADGLAAGKGVVVAQTNAEAERAVREMLGTGRFGEAGRRILIEDHLHGEEASVLVVVSGRDYVILPPAQDHKRIGDGDTGPNTGGMGAYCPAEVITPELMVQIENEIVRPSVEAIAAEGIDYRGTLFIGLMLTASGPKVIEFNVRFGDPETQVVLPRVANDLLALLWSATCGTLAGTRLRLRRDHALCVVMAARGYPGEHPRGDPLVLPTTLPVGVTIYHAGTARNDAGELVTNGGRVLGVTALAPTLRQAADAAYEACGQIECASKYYRRDIGARQLQRE